MPQLRLDPEALATRIRRDVDRSLLRGRNGLKVLRGGAPTLGATPHDVVWSAGKVELWRYRSDQRARRQPLVICHSLVTRSYVFDLQPGSSFVEHMLARGFDVYLINWGEPDELESHYDLEVYCDDLLPAAVCAASEAAGGEEVVLLGYCLGGLLSLLYAAGHPDDDLRALAVMATPLDFRHMGPVGAMLHSGQVSAASLRDGTGNVPPDVLRNAFRMLQPNVEVIGYADLWQNLWNDQYVAGYQVMTTWGNDHIPLAGALVEELAELIRAGRLLEGRVTIGGREVDLADLTTPVLEVRAQRDHLVPRAAAGELRALLGSEEHEQLDLPAGHVGVFLGRSAHKHCLPAIAEWLERQTEAA